MKVNINDIHKPLRGQTINVSLDFLKDHVARGYEIDPDFQRDHVWTDEQRKEGPSPDHNISKGERS